MGRKSNRDTYIRLFNKLLIELNTLPKDQLRRFQIIKNKMRKYKAHIEFLTK